MSSPVHIVSLSVNRFPNKLAPNVADKLPKYLPFYTFASFLIVLLTVFINKPDSSRALFVFMISLISSLEN